MSKKPPPPSRLLIAFVRAMGWFLFFWSAFLTAMILYSLKVWLNS